MNLIQRIFTNQKDRVEKAIELNNRIESIKKETSQIRQEYVEIKKSNETKLSILDGRLTICKSEADKEINVGLRDKIENRFRNYDVEFEKSIIDKTKEVYLLKGKLNNLLKEKEVNELFKQEIEKSEKEKAFNVIQQAYSEDKISKDKFKQYRKKAEKQLQNKVKYADMIVMNKDGQILLLKRTADSDMFPNEWCLPGGHVDPGEDCKKAAIRETNEETMVEVSQFPIDQVNEIDNDKVNIKYYQVLLPYQEVTPIVGIDRNEHEDYEWVEIDDLPNYKLIADLKTVLDEIFNRNIEVLKSEKNDIEKSHKYIRKTADGKGGWDYIYKEGERKSPKSDQMTNEQRQKNFKEWFGDSKVVDENGKPLVVYHGTNSDFNEFSDKLIGKSKGNFGHYGYGFYFSDDERESKTYGKNILPVYLKIENPFDATKVENLEKYAEEFGGYTKTDVAIDKDWLLGELKKKDSVAYDLAKNIINHGFEKGWEKFLQVNEVSDSSLNLNDVNDWLNYVDKDSEEGVNDMIVDEISEILGKPKMIQGYTVGEVPQMKYMTNLGGDISKDLTERIRKDGYDGIIAGSEIIVFEPNQIKSATGNNGDFDPKSNDITKAIETLISALELGKIEYDNIEKADKYIKRVGTPGHYTYTYHEDEKKTTKPTELEVGDVVSETEKGLDIEKYSDKSVLIKGNTYANLDLLKKLKAELGVGTWNAKAKGWFFPSKYMDKILGYIWSDLSEKGEDEKAQAVQNYKNASLEKGDNINIGENEGKIENNVSDSDGIKYDVKLTDGTELKAVNEKAIGTKPLNDDKKISEIINNAQPENRAKTEKKLFGLQPIKDLHTYSLPELLKMHGIEESDIKSVIDSFKNPKSKDEATKRARSGGAHKEYTSKDQTEGLTKRQLIGKLVYAHYSAVQKAIEDGLELDSKVLDLYADLQAKYSEKRQAMSEETKRKISEALKKNKPDEVVPEKIKKEEIEAEKQGNEIPDKENYQPKIEEIQLSSTNTSKSHKVENYLDIPPLDIYIPKQKDILDKPRPYFIPEIKDSEMKEMAFQIQAVKIADDKYLVALDEYTQRDTKRVYNQKTSQWEDKEVNVKFAYLTLDQVAATEQYYRLREKERIKKEEDKRFDQRIQSVRKMFPDYSEKEVMEKAKATFSRSRASILTDKKTTYSNQNLYQNALYSRIAPISGGGFWTHQRKLRKDIQQKFEDLSMQMEYIDSAYTKGAETSFGDKNLKDDLFSEYGVKVKRQNGNEITKPEIEQIKGALDVTSTLFGNNKEMNKEFGLKISHAGEVNMHARKAIGIFHPHFSAIGVSSKYGGNKFQFTFGHEYAHFMDYWIGKKTGNTYASDKEGSTAQKIADTFRENLNDKGIKNAYYRRTCECFARAFEQYAAIETYGKDIAKFEDYGVKYTDMPEQVNFEVYENKIKPLIKQFLEENKEILKAMGIDFGTEQINKAMESLSIIKSAYEQGKVSKEVLDQSFEKAFFSGLIDQDTFEKGRTGIYQDNAENRRLKRVGAKYGTKNEQVTVGERQTKKEDPESDKTKDIPIEEHAKQATDKALEGASKSGDEEVRIAAKKELERRETEHKPEGEVETDKGKESSDGEKLYLEKDESKNIGSNYTLKQGDKGIGSLETKERDKEIEIMKVKLNEESRGKGLYSEFLIQLIKEKSKPIVSQNIDRNDLSNKVWEKLKKRSDVVVTETKIGGSDALKLELKRDSQEKKDKNSKRKDPEQKENTEITKAQREKNFKDWFGDSKVVDKEGKPLMVYHATNKDFKEFKGKEGNFFSPNKDEITHYGGTVMPVYLSSKDIKILEQEPYVYNKKGEITDESYDRNEKIKNEFLSNVKDKKDSYFKSYNENNEVFEQYVVFNPNQIKSANKNEGTFDPKSNDITKSESEQEIKKGDYTKWL